MDRMYSITGIQQHPARCDVRLRDEISSRGKFSSRSYGSESVRALSVFSNMTDMESVVLNSCSCYVRVQPGQIQSRRKGASPAPSHRNRRRPYRIGTRIEPGFRSTAAAWTLRRISQACSMTPWSLLRALDQRRFYLRASSARQLEMLLTTPQDRSRLLIGQRQPNG
jgi:hypothetical protein